MNEAFILKTAFSFMEKFSYINHAEEYKGIAYKLWTICRLIASCGKCDLLITPSKAKTVQDNNGQCIFSRKVTNISNHDGVIQSNFLRYATGNKTNQQSEAEINTENKNLDINTEINPANTTYTKKEENIIEENNETLEEVTIPEAPVYFSDTTIQEERKETKEPPTSNSTNNAKASQHALIVNEYEALYQDALKHINSQEAQFYMGNEEVVRDILRLACHNVSTENQLNKETKKQISENIKERVKAAYENRKDFQSLLEFTEKCVTLAWNLVENDAQIMVVTVPADLDQTTITEKHYNYTSDDNNQTNIIRKVVWPALYYNGDPKTPIIAKGQAKIVHS